MPHPSLIVGSIEVTPLCDGWAPLPLDDELPGLGVAWDTERERFPWAFTPTDAKSWAWHVHAFLVRHPDRLVLVDTGIGHLGEPPYDVTGRIHEELGAIGVSPGDVDDVVVTHLHADHSGGACHPDGAPRFPHARYHVHPEDWAFFGAHRTADDFTGRFAMSGLEEDGMLELEAGDHEVAEGMGLRHAPGHTPGHRVVRIDHGDDTLLLTGDLLHVPPQVTHPSWPSTHDEDPEVGSSQRTTYVRAALKEGWAVGVSHFGRPFGRVEGTVDSPIWSSIWR